MRGAATVALALLIVALTQHGLHWHSAPASADDASASLSATPSPHGHAAHTPAAAPASPGQESAPRSQDDVTRAHQANQAGIVAMARLRQLMSGIPAAVGAVDLASGSAVSAGETSHQFVCASIAKVDILSTLLLRSQQTGRRLTDDQRDLAIDMIEASENDAADTLYRQAGGAAGVNAANQQMGLSHTWASGSRWGLTTTTVADQLQLLRQVFTDESQLSASSRHFIQSLMGSVEADQNWGVSAAADHGRFALKNGWLPRPNGLWVINSIGRIEYGGHNLLIVTLSESNPSMSSGIQRIQAAAVAAAATFATQAAI
jgi:hypothetical protein